MLIARLLIVLLFSLNYAAADTSGIDRLDGVVAGSKNGKSCIRAALYVDRRYQGKEILIGGARYTGSDPIQALFDGYYSAASKNKVKEFTNLYLKEDGSQARVKASLANGSNMLPLFSDVKKVVLDKGYYFGNYALFDVDVITKDGKRTSWTEGVFCKSGKCFLTDTFFRPTQLIDVFSAGVFSFKNSKSTQCDNSISRGYDEIEFSLSPTSDERAYVVKVRDELYLNKPMIVKGRNSVAKTGYAELDSLFLTIKKIWEEKDEVLLHKKADEYFSGACFVPLFEKNRLTLGDDTRFLASQELWSIIYSWQRVEGIGRYFVNGSYVVLLKTVDAGGEGMIQSFLLSLGNDHKYRIDCTSLFEGLRPLFMSKEFGRYVNEKYIGPLKK